jgi:peptidoglycan hydrolase-like protein with peptidoglycan-binding domain
MRARASTRAPFWRVLPLAGLALLPACAANPATPAAGADVTSSTAPASSDGATTTATTGAGTTLAPSTVPEPTTLTRTLHAGDQGDDVLALQQRLNELKFDVGQPDGYFGPNTRYAVWAYQALIMKQRANGNVTPELWTRMLEPLGLAMVKPNATPNHVEVFLPAQAAVFYQNGELRVVTHISSGSGEHWCAQPRNVAGDWPGATTTVPKNGRIPRRCGDSVTPGGVYRIYRKAKGWEDIPLGKVFNPLYFNQGIAIHGYDDVPNHPASHGCVRVPMAIANYLQDFLHNGDQVFVFDGVKDPETYGRQPPPGDILDPSDPLNNTTLPPTTTPTTAGGSSTTAAGTTTSGPPSGSSTSSPTTAPASSTTPAPTSSTTTTSTTAATTATTKP